MGKKILIGIPCTSKMNTLFVISLIKTSVYLTSKGYTVDIKINEGTLISKQRNHIAKCIDDFDLLFVDSDMTFEPEDIEKIISTDKDIVGGLCFSRREPFFPVIYKEFLDDESVYNRYFLEDADEDVFEVEATGTGVLFIKNHVIKTMFEKDFVEKYGRPFNIIPLPNGDELGEDLSFCYRVKKYTDYKIYCDKTVSIGHIGEISVGKPTYEAFNGKKSNI